MLGTEHASREHTDVAALALATVAVVYSLFEGKGPYNFLGAGIGVTLLLAIGGYLWDNRRTARQSLAVSTI
jgi:hypothetical protein